MIKRRFFNFLATALTFVFTFISIDGAELFSADSAEKLSGTDEEELIKNPDFSGSFGGLVWNIDGWDIGNFDYDNDTECITAAKAGRVATTEVALSGGVYVMSAEAEALNGEAKISLFISEDSDTTEKVFTITGRQTISFYFLGNEASSAKAGVKITELSANGRVGVYSVSLKKATGSSSIETEKGASIRTDTRDPGLRFRGRINKTLHDELINLYGAENVEIGMIIVPKDFIEDGADFTAEALKGKSPLFIVAKKFNNETRAEEDGYYGFNCALTSIAPENTDRKFAARAYIRCLDGATEKYAYAAYNEEKHCRSVYDVATAAKENYDGEDDNSAEEAVIDAYLDKVEYLDLKVENFEGSAPEFYSTLNFGKGVLKIVAGYSDLGVFKITENGKELSSVNGYYFTEGTGELKITFVFYSVGLNVMQDVSVKFYHYE